MMKKLNKETTKWDKQKYNKTKDKSRKSKSRIYKITTRPIITDSVETRPHTNKTVRLLKTTEVEILRNKIIFQVVDDIFH